jgi:addiction module RelE/StbE family toxin
MEIIFHKDFSKAYAKLGKADRKAVDDTIHLFQKDKFDQKLDNHSLKGKRDNIRSLDVKFDLRILFIEQQNYSIVVLIRVGTHSQLYG